jgi:hypothetical protein
MRFQPSGCLRLLLRRENLRVLVRGWEVPHLILCLLVFKVPGGFLFLRELHHQRAVNVWETRSEHTNIADSRFFDLNLR